MDIDFHYYATYAAGLLAGYTKKEMDIIAYSAQFVDEFNLSYGYGSEPWSFPQTKNLSEPFYGRLRYIETDEVGCKISPRRTVQTPGDIVLDSRIRTDMWVVYHFLPGNFTPTGKNAHPQYRMRSGISSQKMKLLCRPFSTMAIDMINDLLNSKDCSYFQQLIGLKMHVFCDTWAHQDFIGEGASEINDCAGYYNFYEVEPNILEQLNWSITSTSMGYAPKIPQLGGPLEKGYVGHGRLGHFPDYGWCKYYYTPSWLQTGSKRMILRNNPQEYETAFFEMVKVMYATRHDEINTYPYPDSQFKPEWRSDPHKEQEVIKKVRDAITLNPSKYLYDSKRNVVDFSCTMWLDLIAELSGEASLPIFENDKWKKEAQQNGKLTRNGRLGSKWKDWVWNDADGFQKSNLYKFNQAAEHHYAHTQSKLRDYIGYELRPWDKSHSLFANVTWQPDSAVTICNSCRTPFGVFTRKHHCRACGKIFCDSCAPVKTFSKVTFNGTPLPKPESFRICQSCEKKAVRS